MAALLPMLCTAHSITSTLTSSSPGPRQTNRLILATVAARRNPARSSTKGEGGLEAAMMDCGSGSSSSGETSNKLSAWTSVWQERWEGNLAVEGTLRAWLVPLLEKRPLIHFEIWL